MRTIQYVGPHDIVAIAATGQEVEQNEFVDIEDDDLAASLCEQVDNWKPVGWTPPLPPAGTDNEERVHPGTGVEMHGIEALPDGTETELVADDQED